MFETAEAYLRDRDKPRPPKGGFRTIVRGLRELTFRVTLQSAQPAPLYAVRGERAWTIHVTQRRDLLHGKTIILSSTITPTQFLAAFGEVGFVRVLEPILQHREKRVLVGDHQLGSRKLLGDKPADEKLRNKLFETTKALIESERKRTGLPVAVGGRAAVLNVFIEYLTGKRLPDRLRMPFSTDRAARMKELRELTLPHGVLFAYASGVSGDNSFCVEEGGKKRFVRSFILLGNIIPPFGKIEASLRGVFADFPFAETIDLPELGEFRRKVERGVDWTLVPRSVPVPGKETGEGENTTVLTARNVYGFADPFACELLHHSYEGEAAQMIGRMRGSIPDPVDPTVEPIAWILAHLVVPELEIDDVMTLAELRESLGLEGDGPKRRGPKRTGAPEALARRIRKFGRRPTIEWLVKGTVATKAYYRGYGPIRGVVEAVQAMWINAGYEWRTGDKEAAVVAAKSALNVGGQGHPPISLRNP